MRTNQRLSDQVVYNTLGTTDHKVLNGKSVRLCTIDRVRDLGPVFTDPFIFSHSLKRRLEFGEVRIAGMSVPVYRNRGNIRWKTLGQGVPYFA